VDIKALTEQNEYAKDNFGNHVYISDVVSGQKGYWCIGCGFEMQAVHGTIENRKKYFRHVAKDVNIERNCTFSNEEYRHKLAIEILQFTKRIKVPNLYSYSQDGKKKILIEESKFIEADHVRAELTFYEDDDGNIKWGKNPDLVNKNLLIRPDLTFFNAKGEPLLLLEIVVSHKIDDEKKVKLKRLGINTIQIKIPKDSEENIKKGLETSVNTQWVYNNEQERTNFIQISKRDRTLVLPVDELEKRLFRESYECRKNQLGNLLRSIKKCLGSQRYRDDVNQLEHELSRVKTNTASNRIQLEELRKGIRIRVNEKFRAKIEGVERQEEEFTRELNRESDIIQRSFDAAKRQRDANFGKLEERYQSKKRELEDSRIEYFREERKIDEFIESFEGIGSRKETIREASGRLQIEIEGISGNENDFRTGITKRRRDDQSKYSESYRAIRARIETLSDEFRRKEFEIDEFEKSEQSSFAESYRSIETEIDSLTAEFKRKESAIIKYLGEEERKFINGIRIEEESIDREIKRFRERVNHFMEEPNTFRIEGLPIGIKKLSESRRILNNWEKEHSTYERYRIALEFIRKGVYKTWN
jgi:hypothetical protein